MAIVHCILEPESGICVKNFLSNYVVKLFSISKLYYL